MNSDQYTPSVENMKHAWSYFLDGRDNTHHEERDAEFDRFLARVKRDAAREALDGLADYAAECMDGEHGELAAEDLNGWHHTWAAAKSRRYTHYPEEAP